MPPLRQFRTIVEATHALMYLREHGVEATIVGHLVEEFGGPGQFFSREARGPIQIMLLDPAQREDAEMILESFETEPVELDPEWEHVAERLDLALLDPEACAITCPACGEALPLDERVTTCPACAEPVDIIQRIVDAHGPDALADALVEEQEDEAEQPE